MARRVCPRVETVAEVGERCRGSEKRGFPWQGDAWTGTQAPRFSQESPGAPKASITGAAVAKLRCRGRPEPDARKDIAGQRVFARWQDTSGRLFGTLVHASVLRATSAAPEWLMRARASRAPRGRRQGCQRQGLHTSRREDNARLDEMNPEGNSVLPAEANRTVV